MPTYCHSCPYNKFCKDLYIEIPSCPHGYSPVRAEGEGIKPDEKVEADHTGHILKPEILIKIGKTAANRNDFETAIECYEKSLEVEPNNTEAAFLLKRTKYMVDEEKTLTTEAATSAQQKPKPKWERKGMLPLQEEKTISIKVKPQLEVDPELHTRDPSTVYHVEEEDEEELEEVSKNVAKQIKLAASKRTRNMGLAAGIIVIFLMIFLLWWFGYLKI